MNFMTLDESGNKTVELKRYCETVNVWLISSGGLVLSINFTLDQRVGSDYDYLLNLYLISFHM